MIGLLWSIVVVSLFVVPVLLFGLTVRTYVASDAIEWGGGQSEIVEIVSDNRATDDEPVIVYSYPFHEWRVRTGMGGIELARSTCSGRVLSKPSPRGRTQGFHLISDAYPAYPQTSYSFSGNGRPWQRLGVYGTTMRNSVREGGSLGEPAVVAITTWWTLTVPLFHIIVFACLPGLTLLALTLFRLERGRRRYRVGRCVACGYDLRGATSDHCPECGDRIPLLASARR